MKFFSFNTKLYKLLGWQKELKSGEMQMIEVLWDLEQTYHYNSKRETNFDIEAFWFYLSDKDFMDITGIKSRKTLSDNIENLITLGIIETKYPRSTNKIGQATEYRIVKPIPFPKKIEFPKVYIERYGTFFLESIVQELKELHNSKKESVQNLYALDEKNTHTACKNDAPRIDIELEREKERSNFSESLSQTEIEVIDLCSKFVNNAKQLVMPYLSKTPVSKQELIIMVLRKSISVDFIPDDGYSYVSSLFTDDKHLEQLAAAAVKGVMDNGGFTKKVVPFTDYKEKKDKKATREARNGHSRDYYEELLKSVSNKDTVVSSNEDIEDLPF